MILAGFLWHSVRYFQDAIVLRSAQSDLRYLSARESISARQWKNIWNPVEDLLDRNPGNADYLMIEARLLEWRARQQRLSPVNYRQLQQRLTSVYESILNLRPYWGLVWISLAVSKAERGLPAGEWETDIANALELTPWDPEVHRRVVWLGLHRWASISENLKKKVTGVLERVLQSDYSQSPNRVNEYAVRLVKQLKLKSTLDPFLSVSIRHQLQ